MDPPASLAELNTRATRWLATHVHPRPHRVTGEPPQQRWAREQPLLVPLPRVRYDTARREPRRVGRIPLVEFDGAHYSVPPALAGHLVEVRLAVEAAELEIRAGGRLVARHALAAPGMTRWAPDHRAAVETLALGRHRHTQRHLRVVDLSPTLPPCANELDLGPGDYHVPPPDLVVRYDLDGRDGLDRVTHDHREYPDRALRAAQRRPGLPQAHPRR